MGQPGSVSAHYDSRRAHQWKGLAADRTVSVEIRCALTNVFSKWNQALSITFFRLTGSWTNGKTREEPA
jgi:hypothetical protein